MQSGQEVQSFFCVSVLHELSFPPLHMGSIGEYVRSLHYLPMVPQLP